MSNPSDQPAAQAHGLLERLFSLLHDCRAGAQGTGEGSLMRRRHILAGLLLSLVAPLAAEAQPAGKVPQIGVLSPTSPSDAGGNPSDLAVLFAAFREGLRELGYVEGQNIKIESRWAEGNYDRLPGLAADLVRLKVDVIVTYGTPAS